MKRKMVFGISMRVVLLVLAGCGAPRPPEPFGPRVPVNADYRRTEQKKASPQELLADRPEEIDADEEEP